jgi:hypothetical protein
MSLELAVPIASPHAEAIDPVPAVSKIISPRHVIICSGSRNVPISLFRRSPDLDKVLQRWIKAPYGGVTESYRGEHVLDEGTAMNFALRLMSYAMRSEEVYMRYYKKRYFGDDANEVYYQERDMLSAMLMSIYCSEPKKNKKGTLVGERRVKTTRKVADFFSKELGINIHDPLYQKIIQDWSSAFDVQKLDYDIRWDKEAFDLLGQIYNVDRHHSGTRLSCYGSGGEWDECPGVLYQGAGNGLSTFVILLFAQEDSNRNGSTVYKGTCIGRCWGFMEEVDSPVEQKIPSMYLSNYYFNNDYNWTGGRGPGVFVRALECAMQHTLTFKVDSDEVTFLPVFQNEGSALVHLAGTEYGWSVHKHDPGTCLVHSCSSQTYDERGCCEPHCGFGEGDDEDGEEEDYGDGDEDGDVW